MLPNDLNLTVKTLPGLEEVLAREIKQLGGRHVKAQKRAVRAVGDLGFVYKCNLWLRTALRVLVELDSARLRDQEELYQAARKIPWEEHFDLGQSFAIDATVFSPLFKNSLFAAQRVKDAVADRFRDKYGKRPSVNTEAPDVRINLHLSNQRATFSLDSSGESLHKRNYRQKTGRAPLNEVLAAGILQLSGWKGQSDLVDPMCGSGTLLIEAALLANNIPPNVFRKDFSFQRWRHYDPALFKLIFDKALEKESAFAGRLVGFDRDHWALKKARANAASALMEEQIEFYPADITAWEAEHPLPSAAWLITNPPYDLKMATEVESLYRALSNTLKDHFSGYQAWVFSASEAGLKALHLKAEKKFALKNAQLPAWLVGYRLY